MRTSKRLFFAPIAVLAASAIATLGCGTYGDPCLRSTDCGSGLVCWEGKCVVGVADTPSDAAPTGDAIVSGDTAVSDTASRDASSDAADASSDAGSEEGSTPSGDAAGPDAMRDATSDGDSVVSLVDGTNDAVEGSLPAEADARVSADMGTGGDDAPGGDVGVDSGPDDARDVGTSSDASDASDAAG
jgi:hypothetical protein